MAHLEAQPAGMMPMAGHGRKTIVKVVGGDTWRLTVNLHDPVDGSSPATPDNTVVTVILAETQFDAALWTGEWYSGVTPDETRAGLCRIEIPRSVTAALRRGSYEFAVRVSDVLKSVYETQASGSFLVEYSTASDQHSIPYKDGTGTSSTTASNTGKQETDGGNVPSHGDKGQVLVKHSSVDYDMEWQTPPVVVDDDKFLTIS